MQRRCPSHHAEEQCISSRRFVSVANRAETSSLGASFALSSFNCITCLFAGETLPQDYATSLSFACLMSLSLACKVDSRYFANLLDAASRSLSLCVQCHHLLKQSLGSQAIWFRIISLLNQRCAGVDVVSFVRLDLEVGVFDFVERVGGAKARAGTPLEALRRQGS